MSTYKNYEVWFVTGSQHLYGEETLKQVAADAENIAKSLNESGRLALTVVFKPTVKTPEEIENLCIAANTDKKCVGLITWMHTFSPAKMWIAGLTKLNKPFVHLHTQFNRDIPWNEIDMDFMNLNQSAHGGREFGFIASRLRIERKVIVGFWQEAEVQQELDTWLRAATAWADWQQTKVTRFGDNMREVAVTEGNKVSAQIKFGYAVSGYGVGDLVKVINTVSPDEVKALVDIYKQTYNLNKAKGQSNLEQSLAVSAQIELGMEKFLSDGGFKAFTTTFEDLHGLEQLPGLAVQRLMEKGFGFGAEGDWKTAALVRAMKVMGEGLPGGTSFMEDYTYHLDPSGNKVLGSHMLEVCPSIADEIPSLEVHPLGIGGKADPARLVFGTPTGPAINASLMDMGDRYRMLVNKVDVVTSPDLPKLPVARVLWEAQPSLKVAAGAWIHAGGAHHTGFSMAVTEEHIRDFSEMAGIEFLLIDNDTTIPDFKKELQWNDVFYRLKDGIR